LAACEGVPSELCKILFMSGTADVEPSGVRLGGKKGPYYAYKLEYEELTMLIAEREPPHKTFPSAAIRADGTACLYA